MVHIGHVIVYDPIVPPERGVASHFRYGCGKREFHQLRGAIGWKPSWILIDSYRLSAPLDAADARRLQRRLCFRFFRVINSCYHHLFLRWLGIRIYKIVKNFDASAVPPVNIRITVFWGGCRGQSSVERQLNFHMTAWPDTLGWFDPCPILVVFGIIIITAVSLSAGVLEVCLQPLVYPWLAGVNDRVDGMVRRIVINLYHPRRYWFIGISAIT